MKKVFKYVIIILISLLIIFFSAGIIVPVVQIESKITVEQPVETSFRVFTNPMQLSDWLIGLKGIAWLSGEQNQVGSKWKFIVIRGGQKFELIQTLNAFKQNELFASDSDNDFFTNDVNVKFISKGNTTEIIASSRIVGKNIFWRSVFALAQFNIKNDDEKMYAKLKEVIENES